MTPVIIAGLAFVGTLIAGICLWLAIYTYRKRARRNQPDFLTVRGIISEKEAKEITSSMINVKGPSDYFSRDHLTPSIILPHQNIIRPDATNDEILTHHISTGTMTRPFSAAASSTLAPTSAKGGAAASRPISTVSFLTVSAGTPSPRRTSFFFGGAANRPTSMASTLSSASSMFGTQGRKVRQLFSPVLPDELVLSLGERVTVVKSFDDGWCIVGRDSFLKPGDVEMGAVPAWCFIKPVKGLKASRPMRTTSLGVTVQIDQGPAFSSRDEVISWSNF